MGLTMDQEIKYIETLLAGWQIKLYKTQLQGLDDRRRGIEATLHARE